MAVQAYHPVGQAAALRAVAPPAVRQTPAESVPAGDGSSLPALRPAAPPALPVTYRLMYSSAVMRSCGGLGSADVLPPDTGAACSIVTCRCRSVSCRSFSMGAVASDRRTDGLAKSASAPRS